MDMALTTTTTESGTQTATQSPQAASGAGFNGTSASGVQPGTASTLLTQASGGVPLHGGSLTTVNINAATASQVQPAAVAPKHHVNPALFGMSVLLFAVAIALFWLTSRSEKNTTK
jgi:hypothetical protein